MRETCRQPCHSTQLTLGPTCLSPCLTRPRLASRSQIIPALDPATPIYASTFTLELIRRRMMEFGLWDPRRFKTYGVGPDKRFQLGPFEAEAVRVTHSIPDCCGLFLRCSDGTIVHTGDYKVRLDPPCSHPATAR